MLVFLPQKSSKLSRISSGEDDLGKDGKDDDQKSGSEGGDPDNDLMQNTTDSKVGIKDVSTQRQERGSSYASKLINRVSVGSVRFNPNQVVFNPCFKSLGNYTRIEKNKKDLFYTSLVQIQEAFKYKCRRCIYLCCCV